MREDSRRLRRGGDDLGRDRGQAARMSSCYFAGRSRSSARRSHLRGRHRPRGCSTEINPHAAGSPARFQPREFSLPTIRKNSILTEPSSSGPRLPADARSLGPRLAQSEPDPPFDVRGIAPREWSGRIGMRRPAADTRGVDVCSGCALPRRDGRAHRLADQPPWHSVGVWHRNARSLLAAKIRNCQARRARQACVDGARRRGDARPCRPSRALVKRKRLLRRAAP
jgi:hypothetical protein